MTPTVERAVPYASRFVLGWLADQPETRVQSLEASLLLADLSGFTALSERLAHLGREGAEQLTDIIDTTFATLLTGAYDEGGQLLAFGGDALLLLFTGEEHPVRAVRAAAALRRTARTTGRHKTGRGQVQLRLSQGVHCGQVTLFLVGEHSRSLALAGPAVSAVVAAEKAARSGQIVITPDIARHLPRRCLGPNHGPGLLLARSLAPGEPWARVEPPPSAATVAPLALCPPVRKRVLAGVDDPEHRIATVGFLQVMETDRLGATAGAVTLHQLIVHVENACRDFGVTLLATDIDHDAVKIVLAAGVPRTQGDDEQRMLLALRQVLDTRLPLPVRAGVHRGALFAGDVGPPYRRTYTVMGDTVNLAARLMTQAQPGQLVATHEVLDRCRTPFAIEALPAFTVKGKRLPVQAAAVGQAGDQIEAAGLTPTRPGTSLVGRQTETAALLEAWVSAQAGRGRAVEVVGEPGIGKSELVRAVRTQLGAAREIPLRGELYTAAVPYRGARHLLALALELSPDATPEVVRRHLTTATTAHAPQLLPMLPLLAEVLRCPMDPTAEVTALADESRAEVTARTLVELLAALPAKPTLVTVEDAHWLDPASSAVLARLVREVSSHSWLVLTTRRDTEGGLALDHAHATSLRLGPLGPREASELAQEVLGRPLPPSVTRALVDKSGGNPLFLRELVMALDGGSDAESLPDTVEGVLAVRLDALAPGDRDLVRRAAVLGERFAVDELAMVLGEDTPPLTPSAWHRVRDFIRPVDDVFAVFDHALVRDAAYAGLSYRRRRQLHAAVADALAVNGRGDDAVLSVHLGAAGRWAETWQAAKRSGRAAVDAHAPVEAATLLQRAVDAARHLAGQLDDAEQLEVGLDLARAYERSGRFDDAERTYRWVTRLAREPLPRARLLVQRAWLAERESRLPLAIRRARRARRALQPLGDADGDAERCRAEALIIEGMGLEVSGRHREAADALSTAVDLAVATGDLRAEAHAGSILDWSLAMSGQGSQPRHLDRALAIYEELNDLPGQASCLTNLGALAYLRGEWSRAVELYLRGQQAHQQAGDDTSAALGAANVGEVLSDQGHWEQATASLREALAVWTATGHEHGVAYALGLLGRAQARLGELDVAHRSLGQAAERHRSIGARGDARQVALWQAEAEVLGDDPQAALERLDGGADDGSACAQRIRGTAAWLRGQAGACTLLAAAQGAAEVNQDGYEQLAVGAVLSAVEPQQAARRSRAHAPLRARLGVVRLAVLPPHRKPEIFGSL